MLMNINPEITTLLLSCEKTGAAGTCPIPIVKLDSRNRDLYICSDLHLASGRAADGSCSGLEHFYFDDSFRRFLRCAAQRESVLIFNGDTIDFFRISSLPHGTADIAEWHDVLKQLGVEKTVNELTAGISGRKSARERTYGFKTDDYKSVWRLMTAVRGHPAFFAALAEWLGKGNDIVIIKGNHDLEWYWPCVRNYLRLSLSRMIHEQTGAALFSALHDTVLPRVVFADHAVEIDGALYLEHGHRFDAYSRVLGAPLLGNGRELNLPFGSFLNRYLINKIESAYPFVGSVRPREKLLPLLLKQHFFLGLRVLFQHLPFALLIIPKRYYRYLFSRVLLYALPVLLFVLLTGWALYHWIAAAATGVSSFFSSAAAGLLKEPAYLFGSALLSYLATRIIAYFHLAEPDSLAEDARSLLSNRPGLRFVSFGHTHNPESFEMNGRFFWNTGTWIPIIELSSAAIRHDRTFTFLHLKSGLTAGELLRWNDDAERAEPLVLIRPQE